IWRHGVVTRAGGLIIGERRRERIGEAAGAILDVALLVGLAFDLVFGGDGGRLRGRENPSTRIRQRAGGDQFQGVTHLADLALDLEATLELPAVELAERPGE